jgi:hypothetical protein
VGWFPADHRRIFSTAARACTWKRAPRALPVFLAAVLAAGCGGVSPERSQATPAPSGAASFGDAYSRWQVKAPGLPAQNNDVQFIGGLLLVSQTDGTAVRVTAYREATGTEAWSQVYPQEPVVLGNELLLVSDSAALSAYQVGSTSSQCPSAQAIARLNPASGATLWAAQVPDAGCGTPTASAAYVAIGSWIINDSTGVTLKQLPAPALAAAFGDGILVQQGNVLQFDTLHDGSLQPEWHRDVTGYGVAGIAYPQILLAETGAPADGPFRVEIVNPATGAISGSCVAEYPFVAPEGATGASTSGHLFFLSPAGLKTGPATDGRVLLTGGVLWQFPQSLTGQPTRPVDITAIAPATFQTLGNLVIQPSEVPPAGTDANQYVVSDGQYAAFIGGTTIYVYKM